MGERAHTVERWRVTENGQHRGILIFLYENGLASFWSAEADRDELMPVGEARAIAQAQGLSLLDVVPRI